MRIIGVAAFLAAMAAVPVLAAPAATTRMQVPLKMGLEGEAQGDRTVLTATLTVQGRLQGRPTMRVLLPKGATLVEGTAEEAVDLPAAPGTVVRRYVVQGLHGGRVTVTAGLATRSAGAHAQASWPAVTEAPRLSVPPSVAIPPVRVGGMRIERAIPLTPSRRQPE